LLAGRLVERGVRPTYPSRGIITGAEKLDDSQLCMIKKVFSVPVFESYGSRECGLLGMQLSAEDRRLHIVGAHTLLEPFGTTDPVSGSEVLVTMLHRWGMPLLRYRIGDRARFAKAIDQGPSEILEEVTGRVLDLIHLPGGRIVHSCQFPGLFKNFDIREYQVVQDPHGDIRVSLIAGPHLNSRDITCIERVLRDNLGGVSISIELLPAIDRTALGKLRPVVSHYHPVHAAF
jgi:phenylacetate-CoA ligase